MIRIAVDAMSGDLGPRVAILAVLQLSEAQAGLQFILVGDRAQLEVLLSPESPPNITIHHAPDSVGMGDDPRWALRHQKNSSMWQALALVKEGSADACVSAGNTGALLAMSRHLLGCLEGIERPAICKAMPVAAGRSYMLDLGANIQCSASQLHQFALMGSFLARRTTDELPRVALLNVGSEAGKGNQLVRDAATLLEADKRVNYVGFIEADAIFSGKVEVIVCDGFTGNIALKASEGVARLIGQKIKASFDQGWHYRLLAWFVRPLARRWRTELNPGAYNGAIFLGLRKPVIKSHGSADQVAFAQALEVAVQQVRCSVEESIQQAL